jgi:hypothetical protein
MWLFIVPVRTFSPSKSWVKIPDRGEGYDTPSVTLVATMLQQYVVIYLQALNEM